MGKRNKQKKLQENEILNEEQQTEQPKGTDESNDDVDGHEEVQNTKEPDENGQQKESRASMIHRHKLESKELLTKTKSLAKTAKKQKSKRNEIEALIYKMQYDLQLKHQTELEELGEEQEDVELKNDEIEEKRVRFECEDSKEVHLENEVVSSKLMKARRKRENKKAKEKEKRAQVEKDTHHGVSDRQVELETIDRILSDEGLRVKEIPSDGNCMYHAVADQLLLCGRGIDHKKPQVVLRSMAANYMRDHPHMFEPFLDLESNTDKAAEDLFGAYCDRVRSTSEWGTQIELMALANALESSIWVYFADSPLLKMGMEFDGDPLRLTYHRYYYALGDHYNSVEPSNTTEDAF